MIFKINGDVGVFK